MLVYPMNVLVNQTMARHKDPVAAISPPTYPVNAQNHFAAPYIFPGTSFFKRSYITSIKSMVTG